MNVSGDVLTKRFDDCAVGLPSECVGGILANVAVLEAHAATLKQSAESIDDNAAEPVRDLPEPPSQISFTAIIDEVFETIKVKDQALGCFTRVFPDSARADAEALDRKVQGGDVPGRLAGLPFAVKDLFDVEGVTTTAGARLRLNAGPALSDAVVIRRLKAQGAILVGTLNMDEFAYGFATVNAHFGTTRNPYDHTRLAGGSSGGSAAAVAAGLVRLALGSDTNGSVRVPASLCGVWGLRPASGAISVSGVFPFVDMLDTVGPFTRSSRELRTAYEVLSGCLLSGGGNRPRVARLGGFFEKGASDDALAAAHGVYDALGPVPSLEIPGAEGARAAGFLITAKRGARLHLDTLRSDPLAYDPAVRDRLMAGAILPDEIEDDALAYISNFNRKIAAVFETVDVLVCLATPVCAPLISEGTMMMDGQVVSARANLGIYAQALSVTGYPIVSAPIKTSGLPIGLQFITRPGNEGRLFDLMHEMEDAGVLGFTAPGGSA